MARQGYYTEPWRKHLEVFQNFGGGLNTITSNDNLANEELTNLVNIDLGERGSLKRRYGMKRHYTAAFGKGQGYFRYYKVDGTFDELVAVAGAIEVNGTQTVTGLQTTRPMEAVQFGDKLYIATGTKLMEYDGTNLVDCVPHTPEPLEALYIGTNGLAANPDNYLTDGTATNLRIDGVTTSLRYGVVNTATTFTAYVSKPSTMSVEYKFDYREKGEASWTAGRTWGSKSWDFTPSKNTEYEIDVHAREVGTTGEGVRYIVPRYKVYEVNKNEEVDTSTIHSCNRILLHWDRLVLYGDTSQPEAIYISHLNNPTYFPTPNSLLFENERKEGLTSLVRYRDMLVAFTPTSIQALYGKSPLDFSRVVLNTNLGCVSPFGACNMGNYLAFHSKEGIHVLKSLGYTENRLNVEKIDKQIDNLVDKDNDVSLLAYDGQLHIVFPQSNKRLRYYWEYNVWTKDESDKLDFERLYEWEGDLYGQSFTNANVLVFDESVWNDDGFVYKDVVETKLFDFGQPYHPKKLKELQLLVKNQKLDVKMMVYVYADSSVALNPDKSYASVDSTGTVVWTTEKNPNVTFNSGTIFGHWQIGEDAFGNVDSFIKKLRVTGKCLRTRIKTEHEGDEPNQFLGLAYIFKSKKP